MKGRKESAELTRRVSPSRRTAFEILRRVEEESAFAAPLLANSAAELNAEDRALCYELVLGVLRRQLWLDKLVEHYAARAAESLDAPVRRALRLGLYQLRFLARIPSRAAVNESVNLAHASRLRSAAPFINAVLRRATREPDFDPATLARNPSERIAIETSHPVWLIERWSAVFGAHEAEAFARANNRPAHVAFRVNLLRAEEGAGVFEKLSGAGVEVAPSRVAPGAWRVVGGGGAPLLRTLAAEGLIYMQDEASQLVAHVLGARSGERVLDACAAPGSKTTQIAASAGDGALVVAGDLYVNRLRVVEELSARQGLRSISTVALNAETGVPFGDESFDRVLLDAPCTGTGTLRHNPEIRWRITAGDVEELAARQGRILSEVCRAVRRGGRLVYSTCSIETEENEDVVEAFLRAHGEFRQVPAAPAAGGLLTPAGAARTWPHRDDVDGFFVAAFERETRA
ncbi:MAG TPA: 16S rRNA (cytosine(967)-C(5))-methyltransferase RsmB [Pyrinomonadaceae bacterium]|jgi:16S rRNA (cytosine967-C5)-methyltransferase|nr:16S rRNA (cytosine(967)-C(5))-methyltransferase RsmB [Pyrinomonadaceae bacterium]